MGILDEAIREHLDLKRRRGADPGEVARQEGEVFGPSRRSAAEVEPDVAPEAEAVVPTDVAEHQTHLRLAEDAAPQETHLDLDFDPEPQAEPEPAQSPASPPEPLAQETRAFDPDEVRAAAGMAPDDPGVEQEAAEDDGDNEDVLDETPEFLAETPEHDRLWFEQRPPRDFDF